MTAIDGTAVDEFPDITLVIVFVGITQFRQESFPDHLQVIVFAKDHGYEQPVIPGSHLAIGPMITLKSKALQRTHVGFIPGHCLYGAFIIIVAVMCEIGGSQQTTFLDFFNRLSDQYPIHDNFISGIEFLQAKLMFRRYMVFNGYSSIVVQNSHTGW